MTKTPEKLITQHLDTWTQAIETKSTAGRGSSNKFTLVGIKKLRELILEMGVRGLLVPQDPNDEPASVLLEKITAEKAKLIKDGRIKKTKSLPEISEDEKPFDLPDGWRWQRAGNLFDIVYGKGLPNSKLIDKGYKVFGANGIIGYYSEFLYEKPQLLISCRGAYSGKPNISPEHCYVTSNSLVLKNSWKHLDLAFYYYSMTIADKSKIVTGSAQPQVTTTNLEPFLVIVPPLKEQNRIVAKVDELMALCDQLEQQTLNSIEAHQTLVETLLNELVNPNNTANIEQAWSLIVENFDVLFTTEKSIDTLKQTILQLAVMGKLVPQNPNDEPASKLLEKIATEKAQLIKDKKIKKTKPLPEITEEEKPFDLPNSWGWCQLNDVAIGFQYGSSTKSSAEGQIPVLRMGNIQKGVIDWNNLVYSSSVDEIEKYSLLEGDLLFNRTNSAELVGKTAIYRSERKAIYAGYLVRVSMLGGVLSDYANLVLNSPMHFDWCEKERTVGVNQSNINATKLKSYVFPLPPKEEQNRIVAKVNELMTLCDQLKTQLQSAQKNQNHIAQSIAQAALA